MNFAKYVTLELRRNLLTLSLLVSIGLSLALGGGIVYSIHSMGGPFQARNVSALYSMIASVALGIYCVKLVIADLHYGTIYLLFTSARDRIKFLFSRVIVVTCVSLLFGLGCGSLLYINHLLNEQAFSLSDFGLSLLHYVLFGVFFMLLFLIISMYYQKAMNLLGLAIVTILVLPGILGILLQVDAVPELIKDMVVHFPLYSLQNSLPFLALEGFDIVVTLLVSLGLFLFAYVRLPKIDY